MSQSIIPQLIRKDFLIMRRAILMFGLACLVSIAIISLLFGRVPTWAFFNLGFALLIIPAVSCGILVLVRTIVFEKEKYTQSFIMSFPVTVKQFTLAKLLLNLPMFSALWLVITGVAFYFAFGLGVLPYGTMPFLTMIFLGVFVAYTCILSVGLLFQSMAITILAIMTSELVTVVYLWIIAYLEPIKTHIYDASAVWSTAAVGIIASQILVIIAVLFSTWHIQNKKRDFI